MAFIYYIFAFAILLLVNHKRIERLVIKEINKEEQKINHAHDLVMGIGSILDQEKGMEQYQQLHSKLDDIKAYYKNMNSEPINIKKVQEKVPPKLKVVS